MTRTVEEILGKNAIAGLRQPIEVAKGLPRAAYASQEFFELEQERLFPRTWQGVAFDSDLLKRGDAIPITVSGLPLILVRNRNAKVCCFHNVCRHRATIVLQKPEKGLSNLQCPYHAWTYGLDGKLKATPYFDGTPNSENFSVDKEKNGLVPVRCDVWNKIVFVNLEDNAPPLKEYMAPAIAMAEDFDLSDLRLGHRQSWDFAANWKFANENAEVYHHVWVHEGAFEKMSNEVDLRTGKPFMDMVAEGNVLTLKPNDERNPTPKYKGRQLKTPLPVLPGKKGKNPKGRITHQLLPNTTATMAMTHYAPAIYIPLGPARTRVEMAWYFVGDAATSKKYQEAREEVLDYWLGPSRKFENLDGVRSQDHSLFELQQTGRYSPAADRVQFSPTWESNVWYSQDWVLQNLA